MEYEKGCVTEAANYMGIHVSFMGPWIVFTIPPKTNMEYEKECVTEAANYMGNHVSLGEGGAL